ncbi:hypothetical protein DPMN_099107 [Dreissena polymorpha]|uniref:Uncharacterized protein n=1 Tax=Dreissena polymorpha TaxID=45954 RepID=A0A9D4R7C3_DREPO|nr:hypothetical protein DPMN_099107 [Dreissena polymorpha]
MYDQAKELVSLQEQLSAKDLKIDILKQLNHSTKQTYEAGINDLEQYGRRNSIYINEDLTKTNATVLAFPRLKDRVGKAWCFEGKMFVKYKGSDRS